MKFLALHISPPYVVNVSHVNLSCYESIMIFFVHVIHFPHALFGLSSLPTVSFSFFRLLLPLPHRWTSSSCTFLLSCCSCDTFPTYLISFLDFYSYFIIFDILIVFWMKIFLISKDPCFWVPVIHFPHGLFGLSTLPTLSLSLFMLLLHAPHRCTSFMRPT